MKEVNSLKKYMSQYNSAVIAYSGGVDSNFLAYVAKQVYGDKLLLVTASSSTYPLVEQEQATNLAKEMGIAHRIIVSEEIDIPGFSDNPPDRCYFCKKELFELITDIACKEGYDAVFDGTNADDTADYRPGRKALKELEIKSPLLQTGFTKELIRSYSKEFNLSTATKPAYACLASRFPYGEQITIDKLDRVGEAEQEIRALGFWLFRVRSHEDLARLEFMNEELDKAWGLREKLDEICLKAGYKFVAIDVKGYRIGAMNETLSEKVKATHEGN